MALNIDFSSITVNSLPHSVIFLIFPTIGLFLAYTALGGLVNKTVVTVNSISVCSWATPLPFGLKKTIQSTQIEQVYCTSKTTGKNNQETVYQVRVILKDKRNLPLVTRLPEKEHAIFIESEIESYLGIKDVAVKGEVG